MNNPPIDFSPDNQLPPPINQNYNAPNPITNSQNIYPPPQVYPPYQNFQNNGYIQNNPTQDYTYNPNPIISSSQPYVSPVSVPPPTNQYFSYGNEVQQPLVQNIYKPKTCSLYMLLVMSIILFVFIIVDISVLSVIDELGNAGYIVDEIGIFICAILLLLSFICYFANRLKINFIFRSTILILVLTIGFMVRGINMGEYDSDDFDEEIDGTLSLVGLLMFRSIALIGSIAVSFMHRD